MDRGRNPFALAALVAAGTLTLAGPARAASCSSCATVASAVFKKYRQVTEKLGCRTKLGGHDEFLACSATRLVNETIDDMVGWWNTGAKNRWPTIGPRMLGAEIERGNVLKLTKRTFVSMVPSFNDGKIIVTPKAGKGKVTICAIDSDGKAVKIYDEVTVDKRRAFSINRQKAEGKVLSVILQAKGANFRYELQKTEVPQRWNYGKIKGLADLHVHGVAHLGFAGLWTWGDHDGLVQRALKKCHKMGRVNVQALKNTIAQMAGLEKQGLHAIPWNHRKHEAEEVVLHDKWPHFSDIAHQQVHTDWLKEAHRKGLKLVVMCAVNNELLCRVLKAGLYPGKNKWACDDMSNIKRQLEAFNALDRKYDWFEIALTPWHARKIIHEGKLAVVLSAESSHMLPRSEGDFKAQLEKLYQLGLRSLQIVHERDNRFAGAAPHRKNFNWHQRTSNPGTWLTTLGDGRPFALDANGKNKKGLTGEGRQLIDAMMQRRMLIDVSHYSEKAFTDLMGIVKKKGYPVYNSHTRFKALLDKHDREILREFLTTDSQIAAIKSVGGMVGIRTGPNHIKTHQGSGVVNDCPGSSKSYAQLVSYAKAKGLNFAFGSDFNGVTQQISPRRGDGACYAATHARKEGALKGLTLKTPQPLLKGVPKRFQSQGLRHIGYLPDLYTELKALRTNGATLLDEGAERFVKMWEKAYGTHVPKTVNAPKGHCQKDTDCGSGQRCRSKKCYKPRSKKIGQTCYFGDECMKGKCNNAVDGLKGTCVCQRDNDCARGYWCDKGLDFKKNRCKKKLPKGAVCGTVGEIGVGHRCKSGKCKVSGLSKNLKCK